MVDYPRTLERPPQNILIVTPWYLPQKGGVATTVTALAEALAQHGAHVSVLLRKAGVRNRVEAIESTSRNPQISRVLMRGPVNQKRPFAGFLSFLIHAPRTLYAVRRFIKERRIEVINLHYPTASDIYLIWIRMITGVPLFITIHGSDVSHLDTRPYLRRLVVRWLLHTADGIIHSTNAFLEQALIPLYPGARTKARLVPLAVDMRDFDRPSGALPFDVPDRFILCVAKLDPIKGVDVLIKAFARLPDDLGEHLVLVGNGPSRAELERLAEESGVADRVTFLGSLERDQVVALMKRCLFFVLPSRFESFGLVNLEAHACGKAVISTRAGGIPEVVRDNVSGLLAEPDDVEGLRDRMRTLIEDGELRARLGRAGQSHIADRGLTWSRYAGKCLALFAETAVAEPRLHSAQS